MVKQNPKPALEPDETQPRFLDESSMEQNHLVLSQTDSRIELDESESSQYRNGFDSRYETAKFIKPKRPNHVPDSSLFMQFQSQTARQLWQTDRDHPSTNGNPTQYLQHDIPACQMIKTIDSAMISSMMKNFKISSNQSDTLQSPRSSRFSAD